ncbi:hypothetical protein DFS34DRAFT_645229 [Phlyctochytrium arcticum]|nr:hypothetical protein DFS34DRAFT_645229 [Phlyctochytrium arcticum]
MLETPSIVADGATYLDLRNHEIPRVKVRYQRRKERPHIIGSSFGSSNEDIIGDWRHYAAGVSGKIGMPATQVASPVKRHGATLIDLFDELARHVWQGHCKTTATASRKRQKLAHSSLLNKHDVYRWREPPNADIELMASSHHSPPRAIPGLSQLASFAVARCIPLSMGDHDDDLDAEEAWYAAVPSHYRRWVIWSHCVQLCKAYLHVPTICLAITDICLSVHADIQTWELLKHVCRLTSSHSSHLHTARALLARAYQISRPTLFVKHILGPSMTTHCTSQRSFSSLLQYLTPQQAKLMRMYALERILSSFHADRNSPAFLHVREYTHYTVLHAISSECITDCVCRPLIERLARLEINSRYADAVSRLFPKPLRIAIMLLALQSYLFRGFTPRIRNLNNLKRCLHSLHALSDPPTTLAALDQYFVGQFDSVDRIREYLGKVSPNLDPLDKSFDLKIAQIMRSLILGMLNTLARLGGSSEDAGRLQSELERIEGRIAGQSVSESRWRYEEVLGCWIAKTPMKCGAGGGQIVSEADRVEAESMTAEHGLGRFEHEQNSDFRGSSYLNVLHELDDDDPLLECSTNIISESKYSLSPTSTLPLPPLVPLYTLRLSPPPSTPRRPSTKFARRVIKDGKAGWVGTPPKYADRSNHSTCFQDKLDMVRERKDSSNKENSEGRTRRKSGLEIIIPLRKVRRAGSSLKKPVDLEPRPMAGSSSNFVAIEIIPSPDRKANRLVRKSSFSPRSLIAKNESRFSTPPRVMLVSSQENNDMQRQERAVSSASSDDESDSPSKSQGTQAITLVKTTPLPFTEDRDELLC